MASEITRANGKWRALQLKLAVKAACGLVQTVLCWQQAQNFDLRNVLLSPYN